MSDPIKAPKRWEIAVKEVDQTIADLSFDDRGLIPAVVVDAESRQVLMVAWMDEQAVAKTLQTGKTHFWSRSRGKLWMKGETSGHTQDVRAVYVDCDGDTLLIEVVQRGAACHEGYRSCFYRRLDDEGRWQVVAERVFDPEKVYKDRQ